VQISIVIAIPLFIMLVWIVGELIGFIFDEYFGEDEF
jgi:O-antigen/teichoic acid export membrane protein